MAREEQFWMRGALKFGRRGIDWLVDRKTDITSSDQAEIVRATHTLLAFRAFEYAVFAGDKPPGPESVDQLLTSAEVVGKHAGDDPDKGAEFFKGVAASIRRNAEANPNDPKFD